MYEKSVTAIQATTRFRTQENNLCMRFFLFLTKHEQTGTVQ